LVTAEFTLRVLILRRLYAYDQRGEMQVIPHYCQGSREKPGPGQPRAVWGYENHTQPGEYTVLERSMLIVGSHSPFAGRGFLVVRMQSLIGSGTRDRHQKPIYNTIRGSDNPQEQVAIEACTAGKLDRLR